MNTVRMIDRPHVGIDANGAILDANKAKIAVLMEVTGRYIFPYRFTGRETATNLFGVSDVDYSEAMRRLYEDDTTFFKYTSLCPKAAHHLHKLDEHGLNVAVISDCRGLTLDRLNYFIDRYHLPICEVVTGEDGRDKTPFYAQCAAAIDDDLKNLKPLADRRAGTMPILMRPPNGEAGSWVHHAEAIQHGRVQVARGWPQAYSYLAPLIARES